MTRVVRIALLLLLALPAVAQKPPADIRDRCGSFDVALHSASGDPMEDDMSVALRFGANEVRVPLPPALYIAKATLPNVKNLCTQLTALDAGEGRVLLLLARNNRPAYDVLDAVLIDVAKEKVIDVRRELGAIKTGNFVMRDYDVRLIREYLQACDCTDDAIEDWLRLEIKSGKLTARWVSRGGR